MDFWKGIVVVVHLRRWPILKFRSANEYDYYGGLNIADWSTHQMSHLAKTLYNFLVVLICGETSRAEIRPSAVHVHWQLEGLNFQDYLNIGTLN
jgi:hypothetical protein